MDTTITATRPAYITITSRNTININVRAIFLLDKLEDTI